MAKALLDNFGDDEETERLARMTTATMYMGTSTVRACICCNSSRYDAHHCVSPRIRRLGDGAYILPKLMLAAR